MCEVYLISYICISNADIVQNYLHRVKLWAYNLVRLATSETKNISHDLTIPTKVAKPLILVSYQ